MQGIGVSEIPSISEAPTTQAQNTQNTRVSSALLCSRHRLGSFSGGGGASSPGIAVSLAPAFQEVPWHLLSLMPWRGGLNQVQGSWGSCCWGLNCHRICTVFVLLHTGNEVALGKATGRSPNSPVSFLGSTRESLSVSSSFGSK